MFMIKKGHDLIKCCNKNIKMHKTFPFPFQKSVCMGFGTTIENNRGKVEKLKIYAGKEPIIPRLHSGCFDNVHHERTLLEAQRKRLFRHRFRYAGGGFLRTFCIELG